MNFIIDQGINCWKPKSSSIFFSNAKIILLIRDPRSIYSSMKTRKSLSFPGHDINIFIKWYLSVMKEFKKIKVSKNLKIIKYEEFILNYKTEKKKLLKFLNLKDDKSAEYGIARSKKNIFKAKILLSKKELRKIESKLGLYLQWPK